MPGRFQGVRLFTLSLSFSLSLALFLSLSLSIPACQGDFKVCVYCGDGSGDFEGAMAVPRNGVILARHQWALHERLIEATSKGNGPQAQVGVGERERERSRVCVCSMRNSSRPPPKATGLRLRCVCEREREREITSVCMLISSRLSPSLSRSLSRQRPETRDLRRSYI